MKSERTERARWKSKVPKIIPNFAKTIVFLENPWKYCMYYILGQKSGFLVDPAVEKPYRSENPWISKVAELFHKTADPN